MPPRLRFFLGCASLLLCAGFAYQAFHRSDSACQQVPEPVGSHTHEHCTEASEHAQVQTEQAPLLREKAAAEKQSRLTALKAQCAAFDAWRSGWQRHEKTSPQALEEGRQLATLRRSALKEIIRLDPELALSLAQDRDSAKSMPEEIRQQLESFMDARAQFEVLAVCAGKESKLLRYARIEDTRYDVFTYGARLATLSKNQLPIHGIAIDGQLALSEAPFRTLSASEQAAQPRSAAMQLKVGGEVKAFPSTEAFTAWKEAQAAFEMAPGPEASEGQTASEVTSDWVNGEKTLLIMNLQCSDEAAPAATEAEIKSAVEQLNRFYGEVSRGKTSFKLSILQLLLPKPRESYSGQELYLLPNDARAAAIAYDLAHGGKGEDPMPTYDRWVLLSSSIKMSIAAGWGLIGTKYVWLNGLRPQVLVHELGHNQGLGHAGGWMSTGASSSQGNYWEYEDPYDVMGIGQLPGGYFSTPKRRTLGYIDMSKEIQEVKTSGVYRIYANDALETTSLKGLHIDVAGWAYDYWVDFRKLKWQPTYVDEALAEPNGVSIRWGRVPASQVPQGNTAIHRLGGVTIVGKKNIFPLPAGQSFSDPGINLLITPMAKGGSADNPWWDISVSLSPALSNHAPSLTLEAPAKGVARRPLTLRASASDSDGDPIAYCWDLGDGLSYPNAPRLSYAFLKGGEYQVSCTAVDGRGARTTQTLKIQVSDPWETWTLIKGLSENFSAIIYANSQYVALGQDRSFVSSDGQTWTEGAKFAASAAWQEIVYTGSRYVALGKSGTDPDSYATLISSSDGLTWRVDVPSANKQASLSSLSYGAGKLVAVGRGGRILVSTDSAIWAPVSSGVSIDLTSVRYGGGSFVALGRQTVLSSVDALVWQNKIEPQLDRSYTFLAYLKDSFYSSEMTWNGYRSWDNLSWLRSSPSSKDIEVTTFSLLTASSDHLIAGSWGKLYLSYDLRTYYIYDLSSVLTDYLFVKNVAEGNGSIVVVMSSGESFRAGVESNYTPTLITAQPEAQTLNEGGSISLSVKASGPGILSYQWRKDGVAIPGATNSTFSLPLASPAASGSYTVLISSADDLIESDPVTVKINPDLTSISTQPLAQALKTGDTLNLSVTATGSGTLTYQWKKDGVAIPGATSASYSKSSLTTSDAGLYTVLVSGAKGSVESSAAKVTVTEIFNGYLAALSVRSESGPGDAMLFMGVITGDSGSGTMPVMLRGLGPQLSAALSNYLRDPILTLNNPFTGQVLASDDDWNPGLKPTLYAMYLDLTTGSKDAALQANLPDGVFTVGVGPKNTDTGVVLADIYPSSGTAPGRLKALSVRSKAGAGESTLIVGFIISGGKARVLIRGLGPVLNGVVPGFLVDPKLELIAPSTGTVLKSNDNWGGTTELSQAFTAVALGTLPADSKDAALVINLDPGLYTANLTGMNSSVGIGIVEIYQVP
jgi:hypothetical protein